MSGDERELTNQKRSIVENMLEKGIAMIHLDSRKEGVDVPFHHQGLSHLALNISHQYYPADLEVSDWGIRETLSFRGTAHNCAIPWDAIYAVTNSQGKGGYLWLSQLPLDLLKAHQEMGEVLPEAQEIDEAGEGGELPPEPEGKGKRGHLRLVR